jgi:hypothetical protein
MSPNPVGNCRGCSDCLVANVADRSISTECTNGRKPFPPLMELKRPHLRLVSKSWAYCENVGCED